MEQDYSDLTAAEIKERLYTQVTFDGRMTPDYTESYQVKQLIDELIKRAEVFENTSVCQCLPS